MNRFLQLGANLHGRDFVIGDIHGRHFDLIRGLERNHFDFEADRLFAVGDLIDRGKENMAVLDLIGEPWFYPILGNHELMMFEGIINENHVVTPYTHDMRRFWTANGGHWYFGLDDDDKALLEDHYCPLIWEHLPVAIEFIAENGQRVGITHAGLPRAWTWDQTRLHLQNIIDLDDKIVKECLWTRTRINNTHPAADILGIDLLINGHTPTKREVWRGTNNVFIDLGAHNRYQLKPINVMDLFNRLGGAEQEDPEWHIPA